MAAGESDPIEQTANDALRLFMRQARLNRSAALDTILHMFEREPDRRFRAIDFTHEGHISPGSVHPVLDKLVRAGCVKIHREGHPAPAARKFYELTDTGASFALRYRKRVALK